MNQPPALPAAAPPQQIEQTFMHNTLVTVTSTRVITGGTTYPVNGITSVKGIKHPPSYNLELLLIVAGVILAALTAFMGNYGLTFLGALLLALGIYLCTRAKTIYSVTITTAGGQVDVIADYDWPFISTVIKAINNAIIHRG